MSGLVGVGDEKDEEELPFQGSLAGETQGSGSVMGTPSVRTLSSVVILSGETSSEVAREYTGTDSYSSVS